MKTKQSACSKMLSKVWIFYNSTYIIFLQYSESTQKSWLDFVNIIWKKLYNHQIFNVVCLVGFGFLCSKENPMRRVDMFESISQIEFQSFFQYIRKPRKKKKAVLMIDIFPAGADMQVVCIRRTIQYLLVDCNQTGHWKEKKIMIENFKS